MGKLFLCAYIICRWKWNENENSTICNDVLNLLCKLVTLLVIYFYDEDKSATQNWFFYKFLLQLAFKEHFKDRKWNKEKQKEMLKVIVLKRKNKTRMEICMVFCGVFFKSTLRTWQNLSAYIFDIKWKMIQFCSFLWMK